MSVLRCYAWFFSMAIIQRILISFGAILEKISSLVCDYFMHFFTLKKSNLFNLTALFTIWLLKLSENRLIMFKNRNKYVYYKRSDSNTIKRDNSLYSIFQYGIEMSAGFQPVLSHTEKPCIASYYKQFFTNIKIKLIPV